jgi:hypothetical protein
MSAIPGKPLKQNAHELTLKDGRKLKLKLPGLPQRAEPLTSEQRSAAEPPRDDPTPLHPTHGTF